MGNKCRFKVFVLILFFGGLVLKSFLFGPLVLADNGKNVLILNSYNRGFNWSDGECDGILNDLGKEKDIKSYVEYIDWKRFPTGQNLKSLYKYYKDKYKNKTFSLVITTDDAALKFAIQHRKEIFSNAPIVFGGVIKKSADLLTKDVKNVTGIYESTDAYGTIKTALNMIPYIKNIYIIHDNLETGIAYGKLVKSSINLINSHIKQYDLSKYSFHDICTIISKLNKDSIVILDAYSVDAKGFSLPFEKFAKIISVKSSVPVFATAESLLGTGCIGGSLLSAKIHGLEISRIARKVLDGKDAHFLPVSKNKSTYYGFDYKALKRFNISLNLIPSKSKIIHNPFEFYYKYKVEIYFLASIFIVLLILITYLLLNIRKRKKAETELMRNNEELTALYEEITSTEEALEENFNNLMEKQKELSISEERYRLVVESSMDIIWEVDLATGIRTFSDKLFDILGYTNEELSSYDNWFKIIHKDDYEITKKNVENLINTGKAWRECDYRVICRNGEYKWLRVNVKVLFDENNNKVKIVGAYTDVTEIKEQQQKIKKIAYYDKVTGLPNRSLCEEKINHAIEKRNLNSSEIQKEFAVFFLDLDNFKMVNDSFGHAVGDKLLLHVARRLKRIQKYNCETFRLGGDEFIVICYDFKSKDQIEKIAEGILYILSQPFNLEDNVFHIGVSVGIAFYPNDGETYSELLKNADNAMYQSKENNKGTYTFYNTSMGMIAQEKIKIQNDLHKALENNEFILYYQPSIDVKDGSIKGMEALIRWIHPTEGLIPPDKFIGIAEETGKIIEIGKWVMKTACKFGRELYDSGHRDFYIAVNVSASQLIQRNFKELVTEILDNTGFPPEYLMIEITESILIRSFESVINIFSEIRSMGIKIALDDFGCGYSSLTYLRSLNIDALKIDKSFVTDILNQENQKCMTGSIITIAKNLGLKVIAEGVEEKEQLDYLQEYDCNLFQGYLASKPVPKEEVVRFIDEKSKLMYAQRRNNI